MKKKLITNKLIKTNFNILKIILNKNNYYLTQKN